MPKDEAFAIVNDDGVEDSPSTFTLEFVNMGAISQAERERNQKVVRSTAMRAFRRRQQSERLLKGDEKSKGPAIRPKTHRSRSKKDSQSDEKESDSLVSNTDLSSEVSFSEVKWLVGGSSKEVERTADYLAFVERKRRAGSSSSDSSRASTVVESPLSPLGAGRVDPFGILPGSSSSDSRINELIDHCEFHTPVRYDAVADPALNSCHAFMAWPSTAADQ